jgi:cytochrome c biogenesis protein CcdA/thiol-disulfide isomerase/thioredoxin
MAVLLAFAFISGVVTILSPCILPVLPIVLSGGIGSGRARPFGVLAGFVASFTAFTLALTALVQAIGISADALRIVAVVLIGAFGVVMLVPPLREGFAAWATRIASRGGRPGAAAGTSRAGFWPGVVVGLSLGLIWTPCVGPIMASVISLAITQRVDGGAVFITLAYSLGTSVPMLGVMLGGRALLARVPALTRNAARIQQGFGALMIVVAVAVAAGWDRQFQAAVLRAFPGYGTGLTALEQAPTVRSALAARAPSPPAGSMIGGAGPEPEDGTLGDYGAAPDFITSGNWLNSEKLTLAGLRGKVVMVDFWTYSCVNCVRTLPYLKAWYEAYKDKGFVIVGVHTPEFEFEKRTANVARAVRDLGVSWPVVQDNDYEQWNLYANQYWPAHYFIDAKGRVRYFHFGEGAYDVSERVIRALLAEAGAASGAATSAESGAVVSPPAALLQARTPETYLGYERGQGFASAVQPIADQQVEYRPAHAPGNAEWTLTGTWTVASQYVVPGSTGTLELGFDAKNVYLVIEPEDAGGSIGVRVDGQVPADTADVRHGVLEPSESRMYQVVGLQKPGPHVLRLEVKGKLRLFAFTFG